MTSQWVLTKSGEVMPIQTLRRVTESEMNNESMKIRMKEFDISIKNKLGDSLNISDHNNENLVNDHDINDEDYFMNLITWRTIMYSSPQLKLMKYWIQTSIWMKMKKIVGLFNKNSIMNTQIYDAIFPDGPMKQYASKIIAENIFAQIDECGYRYQLLKNIINNKKDDKAVERADEWVVSQNENRSRKHTTKGWYFEVE